MAIDSDLVVTIKKYTLQNALLHHGKADLKAVISKILGMRPDLREKVKELIPIINENVALVNQKTEAVIKSELESLAPELVHKEKQIKQLVLPELPNIGEGKTVVMRFAPGPSGPLHIGHSRAIILNDEYIKRYSGKFVLRFEDTNPQNIEPMAYDMIPEDLDWLGVQYQETYKQSDRFDLYYKWAEDLIKKGAAYVCTCPVEHWRTLKQNQKSCPDRDLLPNEHLERWGKMLEREYLPGAVSLVIKTDLSHPNPAVRDFVGMRIVDEEHPITGDKYYVYPTYNFSVAIDDHLMGITHILRGKDHLNNTHRQKYVYEYLNWPTPEFLHYGWVSLPKVILKTTTIKEGILAGKFTDWSDTQLGTMQALAKRGIKPDAIRKYWLDVGIKEVDIEFSWETLYALNKDIIDKTTDRYFFVWDTVPLVITGVSELTGIAPLHPDDPNRGTRKTRLKANNDESGDGKTIKLLVTKEDISESKTGTKLRLKDLCNIELLDINLDQESQARYIGNDLSILKEGAKIIHWVPASENHPITVHFPDGNKKQGFCETATLNALSKTVQFERFGFVNLNKDPGPPLLGWFAHK